MPFATPQPPEFSRFADFVDHEIIIESEGPIREGPFGETMPCTIWLIRNDVLEPHRDVYVSSRAFVESLAKGQTLGGTLKRPQRAYQLEPFPRAREMQVERMWAFHSAPEPHAGEEPF